MPAVVPKVYAISPVPRRLGPTGRLVALAVGLACLAVLILAATIEPDRSGHGTHQRLGLHECQFLQTSGMPCPSCGMTTSFAWFVRGNFVASFYIQPMGFVLAVAAAMTVWATAYIAVTGKPAYVLLGFIPIRYTLLPVFVLGIAAWGWKIFIHLRGLDGWGG